MVDKFNHSSYSSLSSSNNVKTFHHSLNKTWIILSLLSFLIAVACVYTFLFPNIGQVVQSYGLLKPAENQSNNDDECNVFDGRWIEDGSYPLYNSTDCPFSERGFSCLENGRKDRDYTKWRWKPKQCEIPRFNVSAIFHQLRGKRVVFVGDSLSRTQWESLICMLFTGIEDKSSVYEINGHKITKQIRFLGVRFDSYNVSIDFYRSVLLMQTDSVPAGAPKSVRMTLRLDQLDDISAEWIDSDILVFNSGHWWTEKRLFHEMGCYFRVGNSLKLGMSVAEGFRRAVTTWASWAETRINPNRTMVFIRTFESTHWSGNNKCRVTRRPSLDTNGRDKSKVSEIIMEVVKNMRLPVTVMHLTPMGAYRSDGHVGTSSDNPSVPDCSHWCLPGLPEMWNEILFSYLLPKQGFRGPI